MFYAFLHVYVMLYFYFIGLQVSFSVGHQIYRYLKKTSAISGENTHTVRRAFTANSPVGDVLELFDRSKYNRN